MEKSQYNNDILKFWFPNDKYHKWWFVSNKELDAHIHRNYYLDMKNVFDNFNIQNYINVSIDKILTDIILLDQFSRNISRVILHIDICEYTKKAVLLSNLWIKNKNYLTEPIAYTVFAFLPIRHTNDKNEITKLLPLLDEIKNINMGYENDIFKKFFIHTDH